MSAFQPSPGTPIPVRGPRRWLAIVGSVGQPRDRNPAAAYTLFDRRPRARSRSIRVSYDYLAAADKIRRAGLPASARLSRRVRHLTAAPRMSTQISRPARSIDGFAIGDCLHKGGNGYVYRVRPPPARDPGYPLLMKVPGVGPGEPTLGVVSFEIEQTILPQLTGRTCRASWPSATTRCARTS